MKRIRLVAMLVFVIMLFATTSVVFAYDDYCPDTEDGYHDYTYSKNMTVRHPHDGYRRCSCGKRVYFDYQYCEECQECRRELCKKGIHYYLANIQYLDEHEYNGYAECYCGKRKKFEYEYDWYHEEPYPGIQLCFGDELYSMKHPHYEYDVTRDRFYYDSTIHDGSCGVCKLEDDYYWAIEDYEIATFIYGEEYSIEDDYEEDYIYYDEEYDDEYYYADNWDDYYENDEYSEDDDTLYDWLELVQEVLKK